MIELDFEKLRNLAIAAEAKAPLPWTIEDADPNEISCTHYFGDGGFSGCMEDNIADYIAAVSPDIVLGLLEEIEILVGERDILESQVKRIMGKLLAAQSHLDPLVTEPLHNTVTRNPRDTDTGYVESDAIERADIWHTTSDNRTTLCGLKINWQFIQPVYPDQHCDICNELDA